MMTRQSSRKKSIKKWNWLVDETLDTENEADLSSGDDSMNDPDFTLVATHGVAEGVGVCDNNNSVKHNETEVFRTSETNIGKSRSKSSSMDHQLDQFESSTIEKILECPPLAEKVVPEKITELESVKVDQIRSLSNLDLISPSASKSRVVSLQSIFSNVSEIRDFDTENIDEGEVPVKAFADEVRHCAQTKTKIHEKIDGRDGADDLPGVYPEVSGSSSNETVQEFRDDVNVSDVNARNDNRWTTTRKPSDSACTSLGSNKIGVDHLEKPTISNMKNLAPVTCPPETATARGKEKWELNDSNRIVSVKKGPRKSKSMAPRVPNSPCLRFANQSSQPAPRIAKVGGLLRRHKAVASSAIISSSTFPKNTVNRMQHPNLRSLAEHGTLTVSRRSEDYKPNSLDLTIPSGISVTRVKENKLSLGDLAIALRDLSDNRGQTRNVQLEVTDAQARGLKTLGLVEDSIIIL